MRFGVAFGRSSSGAFPYALDLARRSPTFQEKGHRYSVAYDNLPEFTALTRYVQGWKTTCLTIDGRVLPHLEYQRLMWVAECYEKKRGFINKDLYCLVGTDGITFVLPCQFIHISQYELRSGIYGSPILDKTRLKFGIERQARYSMAYCCPDMDIVHLLKAVDELPDELPVDDKPVSVRISCNEDDPETKRLQKLLRDVRLTE